MIKKKKEPGIIGAIVFMTILIVGVSLLIYFAAISPFFRYNQECFKQKAIDYCQNNNMSFIGYDYDDLGDNYFSCLQTSFCSERIGNCPSDYYKGFKFLRTEIKECTR